MKEFNNPKEYVDKLEILLRNFLNKNKENMTDSIWWLRGSSSKEVLSFERLDSVSFYGWKTVECKENGCIFIFDLL